MSQYVEPILTIAIPTYNRASILDGSLSKILPQVYMHNNEIEFIISDNASSDNTQEIIQKYKEKYTEINIKTNLQPYNTGYFGNFKKCKELSHGKYFWLLSDNEHITDGVIDIIISTILSNKEDVGAYHMPNDAIENNTYSHDVYQSNFIELIKNKTAYFLTLTSSVIFLNDKRFDDEAIIEINENLYLGFIFLCNALRINNNITIINGTVFTSVPCNVHFDVFKAWTKDIMECVDYMEKYGLLTQELKILFVNGFLKDVVYLHVYNYSIYGLIEGKSFGTRKNLKLLLDSYYNNYSYYNKHISPLFLYPRLVLKTYHYIRRSKNLTIRTLKKLFSLN